MNLLLEVLHTGGAAHAGPGEPFSCERFSGRGSAGRTCWSSGRSWSPNRKTDTLAPIADFNPLLQMASGVYLTFFGSFVFGKPGFPLSDVPLQAIAADVEAGRYKAKPSRVFRFEDIREAHRVMEANEAGGKMVVVHD